MTVGSQHLRNASPQARDVSVPWHCDWWLEDMDRPGNGGDCRGLSTRPQVNCYYIFTSMAIAFSMFNLFVTGFMVVQAQACPRPLAEPSHSLHDAGHPPACMSVRWSAYLLHRRNANLA